MPAQNPVTVPNVNSNYNNNNNNYNNNKIDTNDEYYSDN
jgi:hypothetical protein